jgi:hypothetical protein
VACPDDLWPVVDVAERRLRVVMEVTERAVARDPAEGIETRHAEIARTMGASIGQGYLYGHPGRLPTGTRPPRAAVGLVREPAAVEDRTPFEVVAAERVPERAPKDLLLPMSMHIEHKALDAAEPGVLLACFQEARHFTRRPGASLAPEDPLRGEWDVILVGPHFPAALVARDCGDDGPDADRRFDFVITHDRELVVQVAQALLDKLAPAG